MITVFGFMAPIPETLMSCSIPLLRFVERVSSTNAFTCNDSWGSVDDGEYLPWDDLSVTASLMLFPAEDPDLMMIDCLDSPDPPRTVHPSSSGWQSQWERSKTWDCEPTTVSEVARTWCEPSSGPATANTSSPQQLIMTTSDENLRVNLMKYQSLAQRSPVSILERREDVETSDEWETENDGHSSCSHLVKLFFIPVRHHLIEERWGPSWRWFLWDRWGWCARRRSGMLVWS